MLAIGGGLVLYTAKVVRFAISQKDNYLSKFFGYNMSKIGGNCSLIDCGLSDISTKKIAELALTDSVILTKARYLSYNDIVNILECARNGEL